MPDLKRYREKRDLGSTPEPAGAERAGRALAPGAVRAFVVQQHAARAMHWDLRLEIDGVLVSFAVPKGPTLDPAERRLAVRTEDHPLEYADFEGVIPAGNYGAGAMIVWDRGSYRSVDGVAPAEGLAVGKLDLAFEGHKLRGRFALVRMKSQEERNWLLLAKGRPAPVGGELVEQEPFSVLSGLRVDELGAPVARDAEVSGLPAVARAPERALAPTELRPMLATRTEGPFSADGWVFELKYDGVRALLEKRVDGSVRIHARSGADRTRIYPELARAIPHLPVSSCVLDGEIVALDAGGRSSFERMQRRFTQTDSAAIERAELEVPVVYYAFDLLAVCGRDLRREPLAARKDVLARFCPRLGLVRFADHVAGDGQALFEVAQQHGLEGVVGKRADSRYVSGQRSKSWLKVRVPARAPLVIVGIVPGKGSRAALGSLMVAWNAPSGLVYAGNVGSGISAAVERELLALAAEAQVPEPACSDVPQPPVRGTRYVRPERVCEVSYTEVTESGVLRQPVFCGLRSELRPDDCPAPAEVVAPANLEELAEHAAVPGASAREPRVEVTRPDKVFWPVEGYTKGDLLAYYEAAWLFLEPYLRDRPVVLTRYPDGIEGKFFYQKNVPDFTPDWVQREKIDDTDYFICNDLRSLLYVINSGAIPLHVWHSRRTDLEHPDWLILDLDPKDAPFAHVVRVARHLHGLLDELGAAHYVKTSGQAGLHVLLPLGGQLDHEQGRALGEVLARVVCAELPEIATIARPLAARASRVYVDFLQNGRGKLIAAPFSVRPRPRAPVSMPLRWPQVTARLDPARFNIESALARIEADGDPLRGVLEESVDVADLLGALGERLAVAQGGGGER